MEYDDSERACELAERARAFVDSVVLPTERDLGGGETVTPVTTADLRESPEPGGLLPADRYRTRDVLALREERDEHVAGLGDCRRCLP